MKYYSVSEDSNSDSFIYTWIYVAYSSKMKRHFHDKAEKMKESFATRPAFQKDVQGSPQQKKRTIPTIVST